MKQTDKIFIAGRNGMAGSAIERKFHQEGYENIIGLSSHELDLRIQKDVLDYFDKEKPDYVILAAAKVGGIMANMTFPADFLYDNLCIQNNIINAAYKNNVKKLMFLATSCSYPRTCPQPMKEDYLMDGKLEPTNEAYAIAKIAGLKLCQYYNSQYGTNYITVMPCNIYGIGDNFDLKNSHVVAALIRKMHEAKLERKKSVDIWGTGKARREFMFSEDLGDACFYLFQTFNENNFINVGTGVDHTILELAETIKSVVGFEGNLNFDTTKPDGMPQKLLDITYLTKKGWTTTTNLVNGIKQTYNYYLQQAQ